MSIFYSGKPEDGRRPTYIRNSTQESGRHYQVVLAKDINGVPAGTVFGEYCSYYSANLAAEDSGFSDSLAIHDLRQGKM